MFFEKKKKNNEQVYLLLLVVIVAIILIIVGFTLFKSVLFPLLVSQLWSFILSLLRDSIKKFFSI